MIHYLLRSVFLCGLIVVIGCGGGTRNATPEATANPDRFLYERGLEALKQRKWIDAREYFRQVVDNYPGSPLRADAKLGVGDAYLGEHSAESLVLADTEYREFLTFYPTHPRADYAQFKLAMSYYEQMRAPDRDQTATREALEEFQVFFTRFPNSSLMPEARQRYREVRDRLSEHNFRVGLTYYRLRADAGALSRFQEVLKEDPEYTGRDQVYYYLAELYLRNNRQDEAIPYYTRLVTEFAESEYLERAQKRLETLKAK